MNSKHAQESDVLFDGIHYELMEDDDQARTERLQKRRWHMLRQELKSHNGRAGQ